MDQAVDNKLRVGDWGVDPLSGQITRGTEVVRLEPRTLRLLVCLAERAGEVVGADELLAQVWPGVIVTPDSVYQAVAALRKILGDDSRQPRYIVTVPRQGYRLIATVTPWRASDDDAAPLAPIQVVTAATPSRRRGPMLALAFAAVALLATGTWWFTRAPNPADTMAPIQARSIAVLPFLDLTDQMAEEYFADGMTEELIDRLSKVPGLNVPSPTSSFYFKGRHLAVARIAERLGVAYVVDGSVRKSAGTVRVAARLVRADDGFVLWSETYDRDASDLLMIQDDIASHVAAALRPVFERDAAMPMN